MRRIGLLFLLALCVGTAAAQDKSLRMGVSAADVGSLDPHRSAAGQDKAIFAQLFNALVRLPPGSADIARVEPDLAESWQASPDGLVWVFKLRRGVQFHHGYGEVTADDVVHSLTRAADPKRSSFAPDFSEIAAIEAVDAAVVKITLKRQMPSLLGLVADYHGGLIISAKADRELGEDFKLKPVGTGAFAFASYEPKTSATLVAHRGYFRGRAMIDTIVVRYMPSDQTRELALRTGELDAIFGRRDQRWVERMKEAPGVVVDVFGPGELLTLFVNTKRAPLTDLRVRRALLHAIDRDAIRRSVGPDITILARSVVPPGYVGELAEPWPYAFDPAKAQALLAEAGLAGGFTIKAVSSTNTALLPLMQQAQAHLRKLNVTLDLDVVDHATYHAKIREDLSALTAYGAARFPIADSYLTQFYHSRASVGRPTAVTNFAHCDAGDAEIDAARGEPDMGKQRALWESAQRKIADAACSIPLYELKMVWARSAKLDYGYVLEGALGLTPPITEKTRLN